MDEKEEEERGFISTEGLDLESLEEPWDAPGQRGWTLAAG
jgi:hypothetical protein